MVVVPSFQAPLQKIAVVLTVPSFQTLLLIVTDWVFAPRRTIPGMIVAAGAVGRKHHSAFHRLFASARWSLDELGLLPFGLVAPEVELSLKTRG